MFAGDPPLPAQDGDLFPACPVEQGSETEGPIAAVLEAINSNNRKAQDTISKWLDTTKTDMLSTMESLLTRVNAQNEAICKQLGVVLLNEQKIHTAGTGEPWASTDFALANLKELVGFAPFGSAFNVPDKFVDRAQDVSHACRPSTGKPGHRPLPPSTPAPSAASIAFKHRQRLTQLNGLNLSDEDEIACPNHLNSNLGKDSTPHTPGTRPWLAPSVSQGSACGRASVESDDSVFEPSRTDGDDEDEDENDTPSTASGDNGDYQDGSFRAAKKGGFLMDPTEMKEQVRELLAKPDGENGSALSEKGTWQAIAKSHWFENWSLLLITVNAIYISVDIDLNHEVVLFQADPIFQVAEHGFCIAFLVEWFIRFMAFQDKYRAMLNRWFLFDTGLVTMMVVETWFLTAFLYVVGPGSISSGGSGSTAVRLLRLARLTRLARCVRILRSFPELVILIKGLWVASRSVMFTLILLFIIIYIFAIVFRQLADEMPIGDKYFRSVPQAVTVLLLRGTLPDLADIMYDIGDASLLLAGVLFCFVLLGSLTVMNMLVGVLVEVVKVVSTVEQEELMVSFVKTRLYELVNTEAIDRDCNGMLHKNEFVAMLRNARCCRFINDCGVDVVGLVEFTDLIFRDTEEIPLFSFVELILQLRGSNVATVKDLVDMRKFMVQELRNLVVDLQGPERRFNNRHNTLRGRKARSPRSRGRDSAWPQDSRSSGHRSWDSAPRFNKSIATVKQSQVAPARDLDYPNFLQQLNYLRDGESHVWEDGEDV